MNNSETVTKAFRRMLKAGEMRRLPKSKRDLELFLALAASSLDPQIVYTEPELNERLIDWMAGFTYPGTLDHVTVRRYLVDYFFLLREPTGEKYRTNQAVINTTILPEARSVQPAAILEETRMDRAIRRRRNEEA